MCRDVVILTHEPVKTRTFTVTFCNVQVNLIVFIVILNSRALDLQYIMLTESCRRKVWENSNILRDTL